MVEIDVTCNLESFRRFLINSTCRSFMPESYMRDPEVFPEKEEEPGSIYIEAADKVDLKKIRDITFINARDILGIIYTSKSGNTKLKWRQLRGRIGRVNGGFDEQPRQPLDGEGDNSGVRRIPHGQLGRSDGWRGERSCDGTERITASEPLIGSAGAVNPSPTRRPVGMLP